jgi:hypothetical protein
VSIDALLHRERASQRTARRGEGDHETVAEVFDLISSRRDNRLAKNREVGLP